MAGVQINEQEVRQAELTAMRSRSFRENITKRIRNNRLAYFSLWVIIILGTVALFADFISYDKPIYASYKGKTYFPILYDYANDLGIYTWDGDLVNTEWRELELDNALWPLIRYKPKNIDISNSQYTGPFERQDVKHWKEWHYLGTDAVGRDVLSALIHGSRISLTIGLISAGISAFIGIFLGACAGYFGDDRLQMTIPRLFFSIIGGFLGFFYGFFIRSGVLANALDSGIGNFILQTFLSILIFASVTFLVGLLGKPFELIPIFRKKVNIWVDIIVSRTIEIVISLPTLLLIITIGAIAAPSIYLVMLVIGLTTWPRIARFTRAEMLKVRGLEYVEAAQSMGYSEFRVIFRHALPNTLAPAFVAIAFGVAQAILIEASLSFLGVGVPPDTLTWGSLLNAARNDISAWWLAIFPGLSIFITITVFNLLGEGLRDALDPKLKH